MSQIVTQTVDLEGLDQAIDTTGVTIWDGLIAFGVLVATFIIARLVKRAIRRFIHRVEGVPDHTGELAARIGSILVWAAGIVIALGFVGVEVGALLLSLGVVLVIIAFALQPLLANFSAGLILEARGPFKPGDQISTHGFDGTVMEINSRSVVIKTTDGEKVHIPNLSVLEQPFVNYTALGARRTSLDVGLAYESDLEKARSIMMASLQQVDGVLDEPPPEVFVHQFDDSTINASVRFWHGPEIRQEWLVRNQVAVALKTALDQAGITIAFPQRVLWWGHDQERPPLS